MILQIKEHPDYGVTDSGEVLSLKGKAIKVLKPDVSNGYPRIILDGERHYLADLVAHYFLGPKPDQSYKIFYIDGDKTNCDISNLKWMNLSDIQRYSQCSIERRIQLLGTHE